MLDSPVFVEFCKNFPFVSIGRTPVSVWVVQENRSTYEKSSFADELSMSHNPTIGKIGLARPLIKISMECCLLLSDKWDEVDYHLQLIFSEEVNK